MGRLNGIRNVLFDLDGTLVDSRGTIVDSIRHALDTLRAAPPDARDIESLIGVPLLDIFRDAYGLPREQALLAIEIYREHYDALNQAGTTVYEGVPEGLASLRESGYRLFVATVKPTPIAEKVLADLELRVFFDGVAGASMGPERREKHGIIAWALGEFGLDAGESLMVGDRGQDVEGARGNGLSSLAVSYGFGHAEEIRQARPDFQVERFAIIPELLGAGG